MHLTIGELKGSGVVATLIVAGIGLTLYEPLAAAGKVALFAGIAIGILYGVLGGIGIAKRLGLRW